MFFFSSSAIVKQQQLIAKLLFLSTPASIISSLSDENIAVFPF
jgi:hypothetical protein